MAKKPAPADNPRKGPSIIVQLGVLVVLTGVALGTGWLTGMMLLGELPAQGSGAEAHASVAYEEEPGSDNAAEGLHIFRLEPITTNLADPTDIWARMELALVFNDTPDPVIAEEVHQDFLAYLRTVKSRQIEGASGFQHLKTDLEELASIRSEGKIKKILVRTLLFE